MYEFLTAGAFLAAGLLLSWVSACAQDRPAEAEPFIRAPDTVSPQARKYLELLPDPASLPALPAPNDLIGWKRAWLANEAANEPRVRATLKRYRPSVTKRTLGGVPVLDIKPKGWKENGKVRVHAHGGAYVLNSAHSRLQASVPAAAVTGLRVVSVDYTLAPVGKWRQVTDEMVAVIDALHKAGYGLRDIAVCGESAGGGLAAAAVLKMRDGGLGMPAAVVLWSPWSDLTNRGDSAVTLKSFDPNHLYDKHLKPAAAAYADPKDQKHPYVSPVYADYSKGFPPTLIQGGTREIFLSHFVRQYRAIDGAGRLAILDLYDGMPHNFQIRPAMADAPEARAALQKMRSFLKQHLRG